MKRIVALAFPFLVLVGTMIALGTFEARRTPDWEGELNSYIARSRAPDETITVQAIVEASRPWNFSAAMGKPAGNRNDWPWVFGQSPPYPPTALWCVLLERTRKPAEEAPGESIRQVVFVAYHSDGLWRVGWLVHEGPREALTPELIAGLDVIGCDLGLK